MSRPESQAVTSPDARQHATGLRLLYSSQYAAGKELLAARQPGRPGRPLLLLPRPVGSTRASGTHSGLRQGSAWRMQNLPPRRPVVDGSADCVQGPARGTIDGAQHLRSKQAKTKRQPAGTNTTDRDSRQVARTGRRIVGPGISPADLQSFRLRASSIRGKAPGSDVGVSQQTDGPHPGSALLPKAGQGIPVPSPSRRLPRISANRSRRSYRAWYRDPAAQPWNLATPVGATGSRTRGACSASSRPDSTNCPTEELHPRHPQKSTRMPAGRPPEGRNHRTKRQYRSWHVHRFG